MKLTPAVLCFFGSTLLACCATDLSLGAHEQAVLGGRPASAGEFPTVVGIGVGGGLCSGTLIAPSIVLTAAHCLDPSFLGLANQAQVTQSVTVYVDRLDLTRPTGFTVSATDTRPHSGWSPNGWSYDIGIITLSRPIDEHEPSPILRDASQDPVGTHLVMAGYGEYDLQHNVAVKYVLDDKVTISCQDPQLAGWQIPGDDLLCYSQRDGSGVCSGDSGGPAFVHVDNELAVAGITSVGDSNCSEWGASTRVAPLIDWLDPLLVDAGQCDANGVCVASCGLNDPDCAGGGSCNVRPTGGRAANAAQLALLFAALLFVARRRA